MCFFCPKQSARIQTITLQLRSWWKRVVFTFASRRIDVASNANVFYHFDSKLKSNEIHFRKHEFMKSIHWLWCVRFSKEERMFAKKKMNEFQPIDFNFKMLEKNDRLHVHYTSLSHKFDFKSKIVNPSSQTTWECQFWFVNFTKWTKKKSVIFFRRVLHE